MPTKLELKITCYDKATTILTTYAEGLPPIGNMTPEAAIDMIGYLKETEKDLEKVTNILWGRLSALQGGGHPTDSKGTPVPDEVAGDVFEYTMRPTDRVAVDQGAVKAYMESKHVCQACGSPYAVPNFMSTSTSRTKTVKRKPVV